MNPEELNRLCKGSFIDLLNIEFTELTGSSIQAVMKITPDLYQPAGIVHGGALISLAETVGSAGSFTMIDPEKEEVLGMTVNSQHLSPARTGYLHAVGRITVQKETRHIWDVEIRDDEGELVSISRVSNRIRPRISS
jgi:1,4-dihydroxy-2-naphthoyl-CoA hydrolase